MKFVQALLLAGSVSAVKISAAPKHNQLAQMYTQAKSYMSIRTGGDCPTQQQAAQFIDEVFEHLDTDNNGSITGEEAEAAIKAFCATEEGQKECGTEEFHEGMEFIGWLGHQADHVHGNKDGAVTKEEVMNVWKHHCGGGQQKAHIQALFGDGCPTREQAVHMIKQLFSHLDLDDNGKITGQEVEDAIKAYCASEEGQTVCATEEFKHGIEVVMALGHEADHVLGNGNGIVTEPELMKVFDHHCGGSKLAQKRTAIMKMAQLKDGDCPVSLCEFNHLAHEIFAHLDANQNGNITFEEAKGVIENYCSSPEGEKECGTEEFKRDMELLGGLATDADALGNGDKAITHLELVNLFIAHCGAE